MGTNASGQVLVDRINCGGTAFMPPDGIPFEQDRVYPAFDLAYIHVEVNPFDSVPQGYRDACSRQARIMVFSMMLKPSMA